MLPTVIMSESLIIWIELLNIEHLLPVGKMEWYLRLMKGSECMFQSNSQGHYAHPHHVYSIGIVEIYILVQFSVFWKWKYVGSHYAIGQQFWYGTAFRLNGDNEVHVGLPALYRCYRTNNFIAILIRNLILYVSKSKWKKIYIQRFPSIQKMWMIIYSVTMMIMTINNHNSNNSNNSSVDLGVWNQTYRNILGFEGPNDVSSVSLRSNWTLIHFKSWLRADDPDLIQRIEDSQRQKQHWNFDSG